MLMLHAQNIQKNYGDRQIIKLADLKIFKGDKIGVVGVNGSGKTTLLKVLAGELLPDQGRIKLRAKVAYIRQSFSNATIEPGLSEARVKINLKQFGIKNIHARMSGGEQSRINFALNFDQDAELLIADEPTSNMDINALEVVEQKIRGFKGAVLLVSHDREMLDKICSSIIEVNNGGITVFKGNYSDYLKQRKEQYTRSMFEYQQYIREKQRLTATVVERRNSINKLKKTPKRMGNSEARLHKRSTSGIKKNLAKRVAAIESRIKNLEVKSKPKDLDRIKLQTQTFQKPIAKTIVQSDNLALSYGEKLLFNRASFRITNGKVTALIGRNGSGKSSLAKLIIADDQAIKVAPGVKIGYLCQDFSIFDDNLTVLANVMKNSLLKEGEVRTILGRLLFKTNDVFKRFGVLSGGEKIKASLAAIIVSDVNFMILDEPTNYLDTYSMEALEDIISEYQGSTLLITHDRKFVRNTADRLLIIENKQITTFEGCYADYVNKKNQTVETEKAQLNESMIRMRLAALSSRITAAKNDEEAKGLEKEYFELAKQLKR